MSIHFHQSPHRSLAEFARSVAVDDRYKKRRGLFVTLSKNGKTRACWGTLEPIYKDLVSATIFTTENALTKDYRFKPITASEWRQLKAQVTVIENVEPMDSMQGQDPMRYGLLVRSGGRGAVLLPGEARDPHYQMVQCKLKAGIPSSQPCQLYRIKANVLK